MFYVFLALFCACVFGLCFLVDRLLSRGKKQAADAKTVRQPRRSVVIGVILLVVGIYIALFVPGLLRVGGVVIALLGAVLLLSFCSFSVQYDDEGFTCRTLRGEKRYQYNQIRGEQALATRGGITVILFVGDDAVELSEAMQGVRPFLSHAYYARCRQLNIDPETCPPPAPEALVWFEAPEDTDSNP